MNIELLTDFIHQEMSYNQDILVESFQLHNDKIHLIFTTKTKSVRLGEIVSLDRYQDWLLYRRAGKLKKLGI